MLVETVREAARRFGDRAALVADAGWSLSYAELDALSDRCAAGLAERGVGSGDVVALATPAVPEYPVAYIAAAKLGAITAGVNPRLAPAERDAVLETAQPKLVLATSELAPSAWPSELITPATSPLAVFESFGSGPGFGHSRAQSQGQNDPVALVFTSGTTGKPKGAVFRRRQLEAITWIEVGDQWGVGGPGIAGTALAHLGFMTKFPAHIQRGATQFLRLRWRAEDALRLIAEHRMAVASGVPTQVALMLRHPSFDDYDWSAVQAVVMGGGPVTPALVREARSRFGAIVIVRYSCTEAGIGVGTQADDPPGDAEESTGRALPGVELVVLDEADHPVPTGEIGSVCLRSEAVMSGYWHDPEATAAAFTADGFIRTGDLGWLDDRGRLHLAGRGKEMYIRGGYNVYPVEVEAVLAGCPGVGAVAVTPKPDPVMGEVGVAVVVPESGKQAPTLDQLRAYAGVHLARHKLPEDLAVVDELPLTAMDKLDRAALQDQITPRE